MSVTVKWDKERLTFALPPPNTPLSAIRQSLADYTHLPYDDFKLIHKGAVMKDHSAPISAYHINPNSVIALIPSSDPLHTRPAEATVLASIQAELANVRSTLAPEFSSLLHNAPSDQKPFVRLGELLLQSLLRLDAIAPERDWEHARRERKNAVKEVQGLLDSLDDTIAARRAPSPQYDTN